MNANYDLKCIIVDDNSLKVIDQIKLPDTVEFVDIFDTKDAWSVIKDMKVRGAPLIAVVALQGLKVELKSLEKENFFTNLMDLNSHISERCKFLKTSRPTAVNMTNDLDGLTDLLKSYNNDFHNVAEVLSNVYKYVNENFIDYENSSYEIARHGADLIEKTFSEKSSISILTICNTGKLAMPGIGTALGIIREINRRNKLKTLYIPETRPYNQGSRLTAFEAMKDNLPGVLISDSMAGMLMRNKMVDCVIVGADRITKLGYTANKIGTYTYSVLAKQHNIPFYVAAPFSTIDLNLSFGKEIIIEERPGDELRKVQNTEIYLTPANMPVWNPSFDVTPPNLIESIITERGCYEYDKSENSDWKKLSNEGLVEYLKEIGLFKKNENICVTDVADGNLNFAYRIQGNENIYCVKQALPWVKCVGSSWPLSLKRAMFESEALKYAESICPENVPKFNHFDNNLSVVIMEFLDDHIILRTGMMNRIKYEDLGKVLGKFVAKTCYYSSDMYLNPEAIREKTSFWNANSLCSLTEQVIFSDPYYQASLNRHTTPYLDEITEQIRNNSELIGSIFKLRHKFINNKQALIHGDLHSGSVMVDGKGSIKVIDAEFAFYGPIGFDTGNVIAHLLMNFMSTDDSDYRQWILEEVASFWNNFESEWLSICKFSNWWENFSSVFDTKHEIFEKIKKDYLKGIFADTIGFAAAEIIRRIIGLAHVADFENISDLEFRSKKEKLSLELAISLLNPKIMLNSIEDVIVFVSDISK